MKNTHFRCFLAVTFVIVISVIVLLADRPSPDRSTSKYRLLDLYRDPPESPFIKDNLEEAMAMYREDPEELAIHARERGIIINQQFATLDLWVIPDDFSFAELNEFEAMGYESTKNQMAVRITVPTSSVMPLLLSVDGIVLADVAARGSRIHFPMWDE